MTWTAIRRRILNHPNPPAKARARKRRPAEAPLDLVALCEACETIFVPPSEQYSRRLAEREPHLARCDALDARIGTIRLAVGAAFLLIAWACFGPFALARWWLFVPIAGFAA